MKRSEEALKRKQELEERKKKLEALKKQKAAKEEQMNNTDTAHVHVEDKMLEKARELIKKDDESSKGGSNAKNGSDSPSKINTNIEEIPLNVNLSTCQFSGQFVESIPKEVGKSFGIQCDLDEGSEEEDDEIVDNQNDQTVPIKKDDTNNDSKKKDHVKKDRETENLQNKYKNEIKPMIGREWPHHEAMELFQTEDFKAFIQSKTKLIEKVIMGEQSIFDTMDTKDPETPQIECMEPRTPLRGKKARESTMEYDYKSPEKRLVNKKSVISIENGVQRKPKIRDILTLKDPDSNNTIISDLNWSYSIPHLLLANYTKSDPKEDYYQEYPGKLALWNTNFPLRPEFTCIAKSRVTKSCFDQFQSSVIYGGLASGHIAVWDVRAQRQPVSKVNPSPETHCMPIYGLNFVGSRNSSIIISLSNDGRLCTWSPAKQNQPIKTLDITFTIPDFKGKEETEYPIAPLCMTVPVGSTNVVYIGTFDKQIFQQNLHSSEGQNKRSTEFIGHEGPVCSLSHQTNLKRANCPTNGQMLSCSFDWSIKMWNPKQTQNSIFNFEAHGDYVTDVQWNPVHPSMFISTDVDGLTSVWNMFCDRDKPSATHKNAVPNSKARWNLNGRHFAIGDMDGSIHIKKLREKDTEYDEESLSEFVDLVSQLSSL